MTYYDSEYVYELEAELSKERDEHAVWESTAHVLAAELAAEHKNVDHMRAKDWLGWAWNLAKVKLSKAEALVERQKNGK